MRLHRLGALPGAPPGAPEAPDLTPPRQRAHRQRLWRSWRLDLILVLIVVWLLVCGATLRRARSEAAAGIAAVRASEKLLSSADLARGKALRPLSKAAASFSTSRRELNSPVVMPLKALPILGRQVRSASALARAASEAAAVGARTVREAQSALVQPRATGPQRVALLRQLATSAGRAERELARVDLGPGRALVEPLAERRAELAGRLSSIRADLRTGHQVANALADALHGPRRYLVLAANNAEMRSGSGMYLSVGDLETAGGSLHVGSFRPSSVLELDPGLAPPIGDTDLAERWGWLNPNQEWRNLGASPRFPANADLARRMWLALGGEDVDGVLALDPVALRALLVAAGPVEVNGRSVTSEDIVQLLLHDQYAGPDQLGDGDRSSRFEDLGNVVAFVVGSLDKGKWDPGVLAAQLAGAARGRHLLAWSRDARLQKALQRAGVTGELRPDSLLVSVLNRGGNKLDQFLNVRSQLSFRAAGTGTAAEVEIVVRNRTPAGEPRYVAGPDARLDLEPGEYLGLVSVNLPGAASQVVVDGRDTLAAAGRDGPTRVVAGQIQVKRGEEVRFVVRFRLPGRHGQVRVEPTARVPSVRFTAGTERWRSGQGRTVRW